MLILSVGKGESTQDRFLKTRALDTVVDKSSGDVACDSYRLYKEDTKLLTYLGVSMLWAGLYINYNNELHYYCE